MATRNSNGFGNRFEEPLRERASTLGEILIAQGPDAFLNEVEEMIPVTIREQIRSFPVVAVSLGIGVGIFLGLRKGDEVLAAGAALVSAAAGAVAGAAFNQATNR